MTRFRLSPQRSKIWTRAKSTLHPIEAEVADVQGELDLELTDAGQIDPARIQHGSLQFPVESLRSGNALEDAEMRRRADARRFPTVTAKLSTIETSEGVDRFAVTGSLTFHGVTRSVSGKVAVTADDQGALRIRGSGELDIRDFGIEPPRFLGLRVHPEVQLAMDVVAVPDHQNQAES